MARINGTGGPVAPPKLQHTQNTSAPAPHTPTARPQNQVKDHFTPAPTAQVSGKGGPNPADNPAAVKTGTRTYYKERYDDFVKRNPGQTPPDYYLGYGDKYCQKFSNLTSKDLSPAGLAWRDRTLKNLQNAIEQKRAQDPVAFAQLERNPQAFKAFAYGTHADAYVKAGLFKLPAQDLLKIASTPDFKDLINKDGLKQIGQVLSQMSPGDVANIGVATVKQGLSDIEKAIGEHLPHISLPHISLPHISLPHLPFGL